MKLPLITIGITCFNAEDTIKRALSSALSQDWPEIEIIVVDDASSDRSWNMITEVAKTDSRMIALRHEKNSGASAARNSVINAANGKYIVFFDDDDESMPERVRVQYNLLHEYENTEIKKPVACFASGIRRYPNGYELEMSAIGSRPKVPHGKIVVDYLLFNGRHKDVFYGSGTPTCALMAQTEIFRMIGGFDESLRRVEDVDFSVRLALADGHFIGSPHSLFIQYSTSTPDKSAGINLESELRLIDKYSEYLKARNKYKYARDWFLIRYHHFTGNRSKFIVSLLVFLFRFPVSGSIHVLRSFPARWLHERSMRSKASG